MSSRKRCSSTNAKPSKAILDGMGELGHLTNPEFNLSERDKQYVYRRILQIITSFRFRGHFAATLDPLREHKSDDVRDVRKKFGVGRSEFGLSRSGASTYTNDFLPDVVRFLRDFKFDEATGEMSGLDLSTYPDLHKVENIDRVLNAEIFDMYGDMKVAPDPHDPDDTANRYKMWSFNQVIAALARTYAGNVGLETFHIENEVMRQWLDCEIEGKLSPTSSRWEKTDPTDQVRNLEFLMMTDHTAQFLNKKYPSSKVFGIEGCESLLPGLWSIVARASHKHGVEAIEMGMAHRGRMNILHNLLQKPLLALCKDFSEVEHHYGDVKYHLGTRSVIDVPDRDGKVNHLYVSLAANPSHLEAVNAVVLGKTKAKQQFIGDTLGEKVVPILLHGDASFSGQGIVPESLELSQCKGYNVGGCVHIIINNQIGFTTDPKDGRASYHCTDNAKGIGSPIFHVNGDDVDAVVEVCQMAIDFRMRFKKDVVVDIVCYRRHGHNELDDPMITHPNMYKLIEKHPTTLEIYRDKLISLGVITPEKYETLSHELLAEYENEYDESKEYVPDPLDWLQANWQGQAIGSMLSSRPFNRTGVRKAVLHRVGKALTTIPDGFVVHKDVQKLLDSRKKMLETEQGITWAFAESLAFGALLTKYSPSESLGIFTQSESADMSSFDRWGENSLESEMVEHPTVSVRLSGQDCVRGTFNQRHAAMYDQNTGQPYFQLKHLKEAGFSEQASIDVYNSSLSEFAVLGFEYGFSLSNEMALTIFEAQFGDFINNAQCVIDNFISSGEAKWKNLSSLVLLLPHGYEGNGPEHSSGRLERFLSLVDDDCDAIPGNEDYTKAEIEAGFNAFDTDGSGTVNKEELVDALTQFLNTQDRDVTDKSAVRKIITELVADLAVQDDGKYRNIITKNMWFETMSAWLLRFAERKVNIIVTNPSTPAQYFHVLRRQIHRPYAKPLVVMSAKFLLHHSACVSSLREMTLGSFFQRVITEGGRGDNISHRMKTPLVEDAQIRRVLFCSGKIFYNLFHAREAKKINDVTIIRIEQIAPFPYDLIDPVLLRFPNAELVWCQEEPKNMGAYGYVKPRIETVMKSIKERQLGEIYFNVDEELYNVRKVFYVGRRPSAAPAHGGFKQHVVEQKEVIDRALSDKPLK